MSSAADRPGLERAREWLQDPIRRTWHPSNQLLNFSIWLDAELAALPAPDASPSAHPAHLALHRLVDKGWLVYAEGFDDWEIVAARLREVDSYERGEQPQVELLEEEIEQALVALNPQTGPADTVDAERHLVKALEALRDQKAAAP